MKKCNLTPFYWCMLESFPFIEGVFHEIDNYHLLCRIIEYVNKMGNKTNELGLKVQELNNWFNSLDVQDEINKKLDEMAESGELTDIIAQYLELAGLLCFNTKNDLKNATNLASGSFVKTFGLNNIKDGKGEFYKIRNITNKDIVDDINLISLNNYPNLVAEIIPSYTLKLITNLNKKLTPNKKSYSKDLDLEGVNYGLSFERIGDNAPAFPHQGVCINSATGEIYAVNGTQIMKIKQTLPLTYEVVFDNRNFGHGGDCCIQDNKIYLNDADHNNIHIVDLTSGDERVLHFGDDIIGNPNTSAIAFIGSVCVENNLIYFGVIDGNNIDDHENIQPNSTLRIYSYNMLTEETEKIFEMPNRLIYLQGMTVDNENFYVCGNKVFTDTYAGNEIIVINKYTLKIIDVLENLHSSEYEGLDYCSINGMEGLLTTINKYGQFSRLGIYSFYANTSSIFEEIGTGFNYKSISISRGGHVHVHFSIEGNYTLNQTYKIDNFLKDTGVTIVKGLAGKPIVGMGFGAGRTYPCMFEYDPLTDKLVLYPTTNMTMFRCDFDFVT